MAQENLHMLKRLQEKTSHYNFYKYEKEYNKAQYYKRSHCAFPSIDFYKTQRTSSFGGNYAYTPYHSQNNYYPTITSKFFNVNSRKKRFEDFHYEDFADIVVNSKKIKIECKDKKKEDKKKQEKKKADKKNESKDINDDNQNNNDKQVEENNNKDNNQDNDKNINNQEAQKDEENKNEDKIKEENKEENEKNKENNQTKKNEENEKKVENEKNDENKSNENLKKEEEKNSKDDDKEEIKILREILQYDNE